MEMFESQFFVQSNNLRAGHRNYGRKFIHRQHLEVNINKNII